MKKTLVVLAMLFSIILLTSCKKEEIPDAIFSGVVDVEIAVGQEYTSLEGITAKDSDGTDLTNDIDVDGVLNVNRAGDYEITYRVTGKNGNMVTATRKIVVVANARIIGPENIKTNIEVNTAFNPLEGVTATDVDETDLSADIIVESSIINEDGSVDTSTPGIYEIIYKVKGKSGKEVSVSINLTIYERKDATISFIGTTEEEPLTYNLTLGTSLKYKLIASAVDYDNQSLEFTSITYDSSLEELFTEENFTPTEAGNYEITYKVTGKSGNEVTVVLNVNVIKQGLIINETYIPVYAQHINGGKPADAISIYTELIGIGEYGMLVIVDSHGYIKMVRDPFGTEYNLDNPIKAGTPEVDRGIANNVDWQAKDVLKGLLGPQGTDGGIPEGGFAIYFSNGTTKIARSLGLKVAREIGLKVEVVGLDIPNFNNNLSNDDVVFEGIEDIIVYSDGQFDPSEGVLAKETDGTAVNFEVAFNNVDLTKPALGITDYKDPSYADGYYAVVYKATGANGYTVYQTRRVTVLPAVKDATISGAIDISISAGTPFDSMEGISALDYDGTDLTANIILDGTVDINNPGIYTLTYKVVGKTNNEVIVTRTITVTGDARIIIDNDKELTVYQNHAYDLLAKVSAFDADDTTLTDQITVSGTNIIDGIFNTNEIGTYEVVYTVKGSNGNAVSKTIEVSVIEIPDASLVLNTGLTHSMTVGDSLDLYANATSIDYDSSSITEINVSPDESAVAFVIENIFKPTVAGTYEILYSITGANGKVVSKTLVITVSESGIIVNGEFISILPENINNDLKPKTSALIYTELKGMGEFGVLTIVDAHGRIIFTRDAYGEQIDINNPLKAGTPTNLQGIPNFKNYDQFTGGLWTEWTKGGADSFEGILGPQGTEGGIPEGGFAIFFPNDTSKVIRPFGLNNAREFGAVVEVVNLSIPGFNPELSATDARILGAEDIEIDAESTFDPLSGISGVDSNGDSLDVEVVYNDVNPSLAVIDGVSRVINTEEGRRAYAQGWYRVVYKVTGANGYSVHVTRRVTVR